MSGIRDLLGSATAPPPPAPIVFGPKLYASNGKYIGTSVISGHPIAGTWVSVAHASKTKLQFSEGEVVVDPTYPLQGVAMHTNSVQNAAVLWGTVNTDGVALFDGMSPDFVDPSCLLPAASSIPYGGRLLYISDGLWNWAADDGQGGYLSSPYPTVWDGYNALTAILLCSPYNTHAHLEYNYFVRCEVDANSIESWLGQFVCP